MSTMNCMSLPLEYISTVLLSSSVSVTVRTIRKKPEINNTKPNANKDTLQMNQIQDMCYDL